MPRKISKEKIKKSSVLELAFRFNQLLLTAELNPQLISLENAREILDIEDEMKKRLSQMVPILNEKDFPEKPKPELKPKEKVAEIKFNITAKNKLGSVVANFPVEAVSKIEAMKKAREEARKFGSIKDLNFQIA